MKKSLLALAALTAFAGAASAQSSVTLYGRVDLSMGEAMGVSGGRQYLSNGSGSRFGVRGVEDLGGGMKAIFNLEHRFDADTGAQSNAARFWTGRSIVGLQGAWGEINLGREYVTGFLQNQLLADPWGYDTVVSAGYGNTLNSGNANVAGLGGIGKVRNDSAITWKFAAGGFSVQAQYAEGTDTVNNLPDNPWNMALGYAAGPFVVNYAYESTGAKGSAVGGKSEEISSLFGGWNFGMFRLTGYYAWGDAANGDDREGYLLGVTAPFGQGEFRGSWGQMESKNVAGTTTKIAPFGVGYHYALSKRTTIYADYVYDSKLDDNSSGYDFGIKHNF